MKEGFVHPMVFPAQQRGFAWYIGGYAYTHEASLWRLNSIGITFDTFNINHYYNLTFYIPFSESCLPRLSAFVVAMEELVPVT